MAALRNGSKCSHTTCMLRFFTVSRLALNPNLIFEVGSSYVLNYASSEGSSPLKQYRLFKKDYPFRSSLRAKLKGAKF